MKIRILIFDDNINIRQSLEKLFSYIDDFEFIGAFEDCRNVLQVIEENRPDVILMDIDMPYVNGIEGLRQIRTRFPDVKVIMQTVFEDDERVFNAICAGADGYILKKTDPEKLIDGIHEVWEGGSPMTPSIAKKVLNLFRNQNMLVPPPNFDLSKREIEILGLLVKGYSYKMIAAEFNIGFSTVNTHITKIYKKLQVESIGGAIAKALKEGIV